MGITTDKTLLERLRGGNNIYWDEFYRKYRPFLLHIGGKFGLKAEDCEDLIQRTMLNLFKGKNSFEYSSERGKFRNYLWTIVRHEAAAIRSNADIKVFSKMNANIPDAAIEREFDLQWRKSLLEEGMEILKNSVEQTTFEAFYMNVVQNRPVEDIAFALGLSVSYIYVAKKRCMDRLRCIVEELLNKEG